ncbi:MAG: dihydrolipoyl dehydrogenase family protein [Acidimicrobiales bacterium]
MRQQEVDVVILGGGSAGELAAALLAEAGQRVALVEVDRIGGACPFFACMPSKALLHSAALRAAMIANGTRIGAAGSKWSPGDTGEAWRAAVNWRDQVTEGRDDSEHARLLEKAGVQLLRAWGTIQSEHSVAAGDTLLRCRHIIMATGSEAIIPPVDGLEEAEPWTSEAALVSGHLPSSLIVLGAGAVGCELSQVYARFGTEVCLVDKAPVPLSSEEPEASGLVAEVLAQDGVSLRLGARARSVAVGTDGYKLALHSGETLRAEKLLLASGRRPRTRGLGLENLGVDPDGPLEVDDFGEVPGHRGLWAAGDITGVAPFTHTAKYQARVVASNVLGKRVRADYRAIPRCVFTDPSVAAVGMTSAAAQEAGIRTVAATVALGSTARSSVEGSTCGAVGLLADLERAILIGAFLVGPSAEESIGQAAVGIQCRIPVRALSGVVAPFPAFAEAYDDALRQIVAQLPEPAAVPG